LFCSATLQAGPFTNLGIPAADPSLTQWGNTIVNYAPSSGVSTSFANSSAALGTPNGTIVSLGDLDATQIGNGILPGRITLGFAQPFANGPGWDFAVFENASTFFSAPFIFAELAYVEVSTDGVNFARFPSVSLNVEPGAGIPGDTELNAGFGRAFAGLNTTNVKNLAGIHPTNVGTAFDLSDLADDPLVSGGLLDLWNVYFVRLVDIPGNGAYLDSQGNPILDTWLTTGSGGLDLDAVGTRYLSPIPEPATWAAMLSGAALAIVFTRRRRVS
jgi:hypothetical protein